MTEPVDLKETPESALQRVAKEACVLEARLNGLTQTIDAELLQLSERRGVHHSGPPEDRLRIVLREMHQAECEAIAGCKAFRDDCVNWLRAVSLVVESVGNAATHGEKAARCRGAMELLESAIRKLRDREFDRHGWRFWKDDVFRSDYPTRELMRRIQELQREVADLRILNTAMSQK